MSTRIPTALQSLLICLLILATGTPTASAQDPVDYDTVSVRDIGPGVQHIEYLAPSGPWTLDVLTVDLTDPLLQIEVANAERRVGNGYETTSSMAARNDSAGHHVVGAVNGDFYSGSSPVSISVQDGEILEDEANGSRPAIGFDAENRMMMELVTYSGQLATPDAARDIDGVNETRGSNQLLLYNHLWGSSTNTNEFGAEAAVVPLDRWFVNDTTQVVVQDVSQQGDMAIPPTGAVLSGHGTAGSFITSEVAVGDTLTVTLSALPGISSVDDMIAGQPIIVRNGEVDVGLRGDGDDRHPRTAYGMSEDSTKLYLVTVDGRQQSSIGMTLYELGDFMERIGVHKAMNVDGGGSSTMVVRGGIVNSPSDGKERSIGSNALLVVSTASTGSLQGIQMTPTFQKMFMGRKVNFSVRGVDEFFNTVALDSSKIAYSVDPGLGTINDDGLFTAGAEQDTGNVYVTYDAQYSDTARVIVKTIESFDLYPEQVLTDTARAVSFYIRAFDQDGFEQSIPLGDYQWSSTNPDVGTVEAGRFEGHATGTTRIAASFRHLSDSADVEVVTDEGTRTFLSLDDTEGWSLEGEHINVDSSQISISEEDFTEGSGSFRVDYSYELDPTVIRWVHLRTDVPIEGVPDSLYIDTKSSNTAYNQVYLLIEDVQGNRFRIYTTGFANTTETFNELGGSFGNAIALEGDPTLYHPLRLKGISLKVRHGSEEGATYDETMYLDNLRLSYSSTSTATATPGEVPAMIELYGNYPNPFRGSTTIDYALPRPMTVAVSIYDVLGRELRTIDLGRQTAGRHDLDVQARGLAAGVYFYRLRAGDRWATGKMVVIE